MPIWRSYQPVKQVHGDEELSEEAVHLAGGMLAAGYRGVVATTWTINDERAVEIAKDFYHNLLSYGPDESGKLEGLMSDRAAYALHHASESMREMIINFKLRRNAER